MTLIASFNPSGAGLAGTGVAFAAEITKAAAAYGLDPRLLAAVAAQETGGPGSDSGRNIVGDGGHGHGIFQIDDRFHRFARSAAAMDPQANADYAARMIAGLLRRYGGNVHRALSAYNAGDPDAAGTITSWQDGARMGYADSVLRHYASLAGETPESMTHSLSAERAQDAASVNMLASFAALRPPPPAAATRSWQQISGGGGNGLAALIDPDDDSSGQSPSA